MNMKKVSMLVLSTLIVSSSLISNTVVFATSPISTGVVQVSTVSSTKFYLNLVDEFKEKKPNASVDEINVMLTHAMNKYDKIFNEANSKKETINTLLSLTPSDYLPTDKANLTAPELVVFNSNAYYGLQALLCAQTATSAAQSRYSSLYGYHNDNSDAFRHSSWNCLMSSYTTVDYATRFAAAHEEGNPNTYLEGKMDLYNNAEGRTVYTNNKTTIQNTASYARSQCILSLIQTAVDNHHMFRFSGANCDGSSLTSSDTLGKL